MKIRKRLLSILSAVIFMGSITSSKVVNAEEAAGRNKPVLNLQNNGGEISLNWSVPDKNNNYEYRVFSKEAGEEEYRSLPAKDTAKVLNIYPNAGGNNLKTWMENNNYGQGKISVTPVNLTEFNADPSSYLKDSSGKWLYDVIVFGLWDANNSMNFNDNAINVIKEFIDSGRGILTGHDTLGYKWGINTGLNQLRDKFNIKVGYWNSSSEQTDAECHYYGGFSSSKAAVKKQGAIMSYPWNIGDKGSVVGIANTHSTSNFAYGDIWMSFANASLFSGSNFPSSLYTQANYYLTTWNNTGMIQTGDSNSSVTADEEKILANTILYLSQVTEETSSVHHSRPKDVTAPKAPKITALLNDNTVNKTTVDLKGEDVGSVYNYYVQAIDKNSDWKAESEVQSLAPVTSGIKGYSILVDSNPASVPNGTITTTSDKYTFTNNFDKDLYIHICAVDNEGNVSRPATYKYSVPKVLNLATGDLVIEQGEEISVDVYLSCINDINSEDFYVKYDNTKLELVNFTTEPGIRLMKKADTNGLVRFVTVNSTKSTADLKTPLLKLKFKGKGIGCTPITVTKGTVTDKTHRTTRNLDTNECGEVYVNVIS